MTTNFKTKINKAITEDAVLNTREVAILNNTLDTEIKRRETRKLVTDLMYESDVNKIVNIHHAFDDAYIVECRTGKSAPSYDGNETYFQTVYLSAKPTKRSAQISFSLQNQLLIAIGEKHLGCNSQFADFATKMLGISNND